MTKKNGPNIGHNKKSFLNSPVEHIDITSFDARKIIDGMGKMSFTSRDTARAAGIYNEMLSPDIRSPILWTPIRPSRHVRLVHQYSPSGAPNELRQTAPDDKTDGTGTVVLAQQIVVSEGGVGRCMASLWLGCDNGLMRSF